MKMLRGGLNQPAHAVKVCLRQYSPASAPSISRLPFGVWPSLSPDSIAKPTPYLCGVVDDFSNKLE